MGVYLSTACTDFISEESVDNGLHYFVGEMQGWRKHMEDAHIACNDLSTVPEAGRNEKNAIYGVFDGHGGKEVSKFCQAKFIKEFVSSPLYREGKFEEALRKTFHRMDELLEQPEYDQELEAYRQIPNPSDKDRRAAPVNRSEKDGLTGFRATPPNFNAGPTITNHANDDNNSNSAVSTTTPEKNMSMSTKQAMEMLQQLLVKDTPPETVTTPPSTNTTVTVPASPPQISSPSPPLVADRPMVCNLKDHRIMAGCTAVVAFRYENTLYVANAGDSRAVLCRGGGIAYPLSEDHKPNQPRELARIQAAGGFVSHIGRVNGNLNLSRSLGDLKYKQVPNIPPEAQIITAEPDITVTPLQPTDKFLLIACDGVWDCLTCQQACDFISQRLDSGMSIKDTVEQVLRHCVADDPRRSGGIGGDNLTCLVVVLDQTPPRSSSDSNTTDTPQEALISNEAGNNVEVTMTVDAVTATEKSGSSDTSPGDM